MKRFLITTDSTCDLPDDFLKEYNIPVVSLYYIMDGISYEDAVRNAVSLGGDTDTLAAIAGAMAEAFFGIQASLKAESLSRIRPDMREVVERFEAAVG